MSIEKLLDHTLSPWMMGGGEKENVILSSRVRMARNLEAIPFPNRATIEQLNTVVDCIRTSLVDLKVEEPQSYQLVELEKLSSLDRNILVEKHIISPLHVQEPKGRAVIVRSDAAVSVMVNEEDHLRIQCLEPGLSLKKALTVANAVDDELESKQTYAFSPNLGYLTACPTNLGTALRASIMVHLPGLVYTKQMNRLVAVASQVGLAVRGLYGEGSDSFGNIFQISNQLTLGYNEQEIVDNLHSLAMQVIEQEQNARRMLLNGSREALEDLVWRAYGMLRYARSISSQEALGALSQVRLGIDLNFIEVLSSEVFNELIIMTQPNYIEKFYLNKQVDAVALNQVRAQIIREKIEGGM